VNTNNSNVQRLTYQRQRILDEVASEFFQIQTNLYEKQID